MRRFARLTNAFSKKVENLAYAVVLHVMRYSPRRIQMTPAMGAGLVESPREVEDIVALIGRAKDAAPKKRRPFEKR